MGRRGRERRQAMRDKLVGAYVTDALHEAIRAAAFDARTSMSKIVERAIQEFLARRQKKGGKP